MTDIHGTSAFVPTGLGDRHVEPPRIEAVALACHRYHRRLEPIWLVTFAVSGVFALGIGNFTGAPAVLAMLVGAAIGAPIYVIGQTLLSLQLRRAILDLGFSKAGASRIVGAISEHVLKRKLTARTRQQQLKILSDRALEALSDESVG